MKLYMVGLVGESFYQGAIAKCYEGEAVRICREQGNPHDAQALSVETIDGSQIGYIPRTSWLRRAVHDEGQGVAATIKSISSPELGLQGVVLYVALTDDALPERLWRGSHEGQRIQQDAAEAYRASAARMIEAIASKATFPVRCPCGPTFRVVLRTVKSDVPIKCPACGCSDLVSPEAIRKLEAAFVGEVRRIFEGTGLPHPVDQSILAILHEPSPP